MELIDLLRVLRRWLWLIVALVVVTELALWLGMRSNEPLYAATVKMQISIPQREDVPAYDQSRSFNPRDEITAAINNFIELLQSSEVKRKAVSQLGLQGKDASYTVSAIRTTDTDYIKVTVEARTPNLAAEIANTHVAIAIAYYGELRAQSTKAEKELFAQQLHLAAEGYWAAEKALTEFRTQNGIYSLDSQLITQQRLLEQLQLERDQRSLEQEITVSTITNSAIQASSPLVIDPVKQVDNLIAQRLEELNHLTSLAPQYHTLSQNVEQTSGVYQHLLDKYSEAELKVIAVQSANFIQVIKPAVKPAESVSGWPKLALLALAGSLGLGVTVAFLLQYISSFKSASVTVPVSDHEAPSWGSTSRESWKRIRNVFRRNNPSRKRAGQESSTDLDVEQEPLSAQKQHTPLRSK
jgi:uncharacterized protein involved in exopolysaccharide biosynthesis